MAIFMSIIMTWIFNNTYRSTLSAILWHAVVNGTAGFFTLTGQASNYLFVLMFVAAAVIAKVWGARALMGQDAAIPTYSSADMR